MLQCQLLKMGLAKSGVFPVELLTFYMYNTRGEGLGLCYLSFDNIVVLCMEQHLKRIPVIRKFPLALQW